MAGAAPAAVVTLLHVAAAKSPLSSGVSPGRFFGELLKRLSGVLLRSSPLTAVHVAGPVHAVDQYGFKCKSGVLQRTSVKTQRNEVTDARSEVLHTEVEE